jgi:YidC/Oxa1 family membrane protein insertase
VLDFLGQIGSAIMTPLYWITSVILSGFHHVFGALLGQSSGWGWMLSIIGLTLVIRAALIPLFVKQIKSSRNMQLLQPKVKELQKKYGHDRERLAQETMKLYKETGTNPFASCLPLILQMPIFLALFRLIDHAAKNQTTGVGILTADQVHQLYQATIFGARIGDSFTSTHLLSVRIFAGLLVVAMTATTFLTQRQLMSKNMPADAMTGQYAQQQKMLLYVLPVVFAVGGIAFPLGVLFYWTTSNLWTMCQQFYVIRNNPAPGTPAFRAKQARDEQKAAKKAAHEAVHGAPGGTQVEGSADGVTDRGAVESPQQPEQPRRQQPKRQSRSQRKSGKPAGSQNPQVGPRNGQAHAAGSPRSDGDPAQRAGSGDEATEPGA